MLNGGSTLPVTGVLDKDTGVEMLGDIHVESDVLATDSNVGIYCETVRHGLEIMIMEQ